MDLERRAQPNRASVVQYHVRPRSPLAGPKVREDRQQVEERGEDIAPFRHPGDGFDAQGVKGDEEGGGPRREGESRLTTE
jgi:hypothetical protein